MSLGYKLQQKRGPGSLGEREEGGRMHFERKKREERLGCALQKEEKRGWGKRGWGKKRHRHDP